MSTTKPILAEQFDDLAQQQQAARLGMWTFITTEIMFFGGMLTAYLVYRHAYPHAFAVASAQTNVIYGTVNTAILLTSSLWMALAVHAAEAGNTKHIVRYLMLTILFAVAFLGVKGLEYAEDIHKHLVPGNSFSLHEPHAELFFYFYWALTGLHGLHVLIGIGLLSVMAILSKRGRFSKNYYNPIEVSGLYWHFVDIVWIFLYPLLYLINRHA